jgi:DNA-binding Lrp family transcriptional regulator
MLDKKDHENMLKLDSCYKLVQQSSAKGGIRAVDIAEKLNISKSTVHDRLNSLQYMGKVYSDQGLWKATTGEQTIKPLEKEIEITLPLPENKFEGMMGLKLFHKSMKDSGLPKSAGTVETIIETFNETRTIKIKGKNVDDLDLEKVANLILQANEKSSKFNLKRKLKKLKL